MHVIVPVKRYADAKTRLAPVLSPGARARFAQLLAERVLTELAASRTARSVLVVTDEPALAGLCRSLGFSLLAEGAPPRGLNAAVRRGLAAAGGMGAEHVAVVHADLPHFRAAAFDAVAAEHLGAPDRRCTIVTDGAGDGTNLRLSRLGDGLPALYGPESARRHAAAARSLGLAVRIVRCASLSTDCDTPDDLRRLSLPIHTLATPFMPETRHDHPVPREAVLG